VTWSLARAHSIRRAASEGFVAALLVGGVSIAHAAATPGDCAPGAYRSQDGRIAALTPAPTPGDGLRFTLVSGERGSLSDATAPIVCREGHLRDRNAADQDTWSAIPMRQTSTRFRSGDLTLAGLLLEPEGVEHPPLVILVHGSEATSPQGMYYQELFAAQGIATFAYDKRGTGESTGTYTQDFFALADDAVAAAREARRLAADRYSCFGFFGGSQGGWVAPRAAVKAHADFLVVGFGVVGTAVEQDQWQVDYQLAEAGFGKAVLPATHQITAATGAVARSNFTRGTGRVNAFKARYEDEPWLAKIDGQYSGELLRGEADRARSESPGVPWRYSSLDAVRRFDGPQLWVFATDDDIAPSERSVARLRWLPSRNKVSVVVYPHATHGMRQVDFGFDGRRTASDKIVGGYLRLIADYAKGGASEAYGDGRWIRREMPEGVTRRPCSGTQVKRSGR
jgi:pimeloyl-ACP methyl ester carboxylesterase